MMTIFNIPEDTQVLNLSGNIALEYPKMLDGGGSLFLREVFDVIYKTSKEKYNRCFEWCCGPGFFMFEALGSGLANEIVGSDSFYPALENVRRTAEQHNLTDKVTLYHTPLIANIPDHEKWDLVIGNPPWYYYADILIENYKSRNESEEAIQNAIRICVDQEWQIHREFFNNLGKHVTPDCDIYLVEGTPALDIIDYAKENGFDLIGIYEPKDPIHPNATLTIHHYRPGARWK